MHQLWDATEWRIMMNDSDDAIFLLKGAEDLEKLPVHPYDSEDLLQTLIMKHPELLAGDQINPDKPIRWLLIKRETGIPSGNQEGDRWSVDHLFLDQNSIPTFVEAKRSSDTRIRRNIIGQMLDYAANAQRYWPADGIRAMATAKYGNEEAVNSAVEELLGPDITEDAPIAVNNYWNKVEDNLRNGYIRLLFVADRIPGELRRIIEFLNEQMARVEVLGIEIARYVGSDFTALVPRVIGQTEAIRRRRTGGTAQLQRTTKQEFLNSCPEELRDFFAGAFSKSEELGMHIYWGTKGFSLRSQDSKGNPVSLFYGFPPGVSGKDHVVVQGYVGNIDDAKYMNQVHDRFLAVPGTTQGGDYTINLDLNAKTINDAKKLLQVAWDINKELQRRDTSEDI